MRNKKLPFNQEEKALIKKYILEYLRNPSKFTGAHLEEKDLLEIMDKARKYFVEEYKKTSNNSSFAGKQTPVEYAITVFGIPPKKKGLPLRKNGGISSKLEKVSGEVEAFADRLFKKYRFIELDNNNSD